MHRVEASGADEDDGGDGGGGQQVGTLDHKHLVEKNILICDFDSLKMKF